MDDNNASLLPPYYEGFESERPRGWLLFFLIVFVGLGGVATLLRFIFGFDIDDFRGYGDAMTVLGALAEGMQMVGLSALAGYAIHAFFKRKPNAVALSKMYVALVFVSNLFLLYVGGDNSSSLTSGQYLAGSLLGCMVWFCYLSFSAQVGRYIPKESRRTSLFDKWIPVVIIAPAALWIAAMYGMAHGAFQSPMADAAMQEGEQTDGIIVVTDTDRVVFEQYCTEDDFTYYTFTLSDGIEGTLFSASDAGPTEEFFAESCGIALPKDHDEQPSRVMDRNEVWNKGYRISYVVYHYFEAGLYWVYAIARPKGSQEMMIAYYFYPDEQTEGRTMRPGYMDPIDLLVETVRFIE